MMTWSAYHPVLNYNTQGNKILFNLHIPYIKSTRTNNVRMRTQMCFNVILYCFLKVTVSDVGYVTMLSICFHSSGSVCYPGLESPETGCICSRIINKERAAITSYGMRFFVGVADSAG